ncbi:hypothetical protein [Actinoplanes palleronii]|uniref:Uncharacterized protein n=1 Tax=Actinoplanes palleronii TaxID=113570 RepID=A0ABQ4BPF2_9ACTN|nr:hypothetical protein [Actinoplanes palleronii]GIE72562.1 hypothetical protein Apa02nite_086700 [Actinoplanes palleronii]
MRYDELEASVVRLVRDAGEDNLRTFGAETVVRLVRDAAALDPADQDQLDPDAAAALGAACANVLTAGPAELRAQLTRIDDGILADGDMDPELLSVITALEHWTTYLETGLRGELYELAIRSIEQVDFQVSADLGDFLADPEMAAEYARITRLLTA